jgi:hypothetical protein
MRNNKKAKKERANSVSKILIIEDDNKSARSFVRSLESAVPEVDFQVLKPSSELKPKFFEGYDALLVDINLSRWATENKLTELHRAAADTAVLFYSSVVHDEKALSEKMEHLPFKTVIIKKPSSLEDTFKDEIAFAIRELSRPKQWEEKSGAGLLLPVARTITTVNKRLIGIFRDSPELLCTIDPIMFEEVVAELFIEEGYEIVLTPPRADGGKDIYVYKIDPLTHTKFLVECKRYVPPLKVDVSVARQLYGVVQQEQATGGIIVTTSYFTKPAKDFAARVPYQLFLTDFDDLSQWLKKIK